MDTRIEYSLNHVSKQLRNFVLNIQYGGIAKEDRLFIGIVSVNFNVCKEHYFEHEMDSEIYFDNNYYTLCQCRLIDSSYDFYSKRLFSFLHFNAWSQIIYAIIFAWLTDLMLFFCFHRLNFCKIISNNRGPNVPKYSKGLNNISETNLLEQLWSDDNWSRKYVGPK